MLNEQVRCRECGKRINKDQQQNFFSLCYECFRRFKSSKIRQASAMRIIGIIGLIFVSLYIFMFSNLFGFYYPQRIIIFIIGSIIAVIVPLLLIIFGTKKKRKWTAHFEQKPIEPHQVIATPSTNTILT